jgi:hypothetical protein
MRRGIQTQVVTPGKDKKWYLAGALDYVTCKILHVTGEHKSHALFLALLERIERAFPASVVSRIDVVADNYKTHKTPEAKSWLESHQRIELLWLPTYRPRANPVERVFGDVPRHLHAQSQAEKAQRSGGLCGEVSEGARRVAVHSLGDLLRGRSARGPLPDH